MKSVKVNGVSLTVLTRQEATSERILNECRPTPGGTYFVYGLSSKRDILKASGIEEEGQYDGAVPQPWADQHPDFYEYVWFYPFKGDDRIYGRPLKVSSLLPKIFDAALKQAGVQR